MCTPPTRRSPYSQQKAALNSKVSQTGVWPCTHILLTQNIYINICRLLRLFSSNESTKEPKINKLHAQKQERKFVLLLLFPVVIGFLPALPLCCYFLHLAGGRDRGRAQNCSYMSLRLDLVWIYSHACGKWCWRFLFVIFLAWFCHFHGVMGEKCEHKWTLGWGKKVRNVLESMFTGKTLTYRAVMNISANQTETTRRSHDFLHWLWALGNFPE